MRPSSIDRCAGRSPARVVTPTRVPGWPAACSRALRAAGDWLSEQRAQQHITRDCARIDAATLRELGVDSLAALAAASTRPVHRPGG